MLNYYAEQTLKSRPRRKPLVRSTTGERADGADEAPPAEPAYVPTERRLSELGLDDSLLKRNQRSVAAHIDDDHYTRELTPADFILDATATRVQIPAATPQWPAVRMPDGSQSIVVATFRKPSQWRAGKLRLKIVYTSSGGSTNVFAISYRVRAIRRGEVLPGTLLTADPVPLSLAGPAVANTEMNDSYRYTTVSLGPDDERFSLQIFRDGAADANGNDFHLLSVEVVHISSVQESQ